MKKYRVPCLHERRIVDDCNATVCDYHPLGKSSIKALLHIARRDAISCVEVDHRLQQGVRGSVCPLPPRHLYGPVAKKQLQVSYLVDDVCRYENPLEITDDVVDRLFNIMLGEGENNHMKRRELPTYWHRNNHELVIVPECGGTINYGPGNLKYHDYQEYLAYDFPGAQEIADLQELMDIAGMRHDYSELFRQTVYMVKHTGVGRNIAYSASIMLAWKSTPTDNLDGFSRLNNLHEAAQKHYQGSVELNSKQFADNLALRTLHSPETYELLLEHGLNGRYVYGSPAHQFLTPSVISDRAECIQVNDLLTGHYTYVCVPRLIDEVVAYQHGLVFVSRPEPV